MFPKNLPHKLAQIIILLFVFVYQTTNPNNVLARENTDSDVPFCALTLNSTGLGDTHSLRPVIRTSDLTNGENNFALLVCDLNSQISSAIASGETVIVAYNRPNSSRWYETELVSNGHGCYTANIAPDNNVGFVYHDSVWPENYQRTDVDMRSAATDMIFDIETQDDNTPLCRRVYATLVQDQNTTRAPDFIPPTNVCFQIPESNTNQRKECCKCISGSTSHDCTTTYENTKGIWTAFGCFNTENQNELVRNFITLAAGTSGGIALLLILFGSFTVSTAASNPEQLGLGQEVTTAAITGLVFIILSVVIMQFIGIDILRIPGL